MSQKPPIIFQFLLTLNFRGSTHKNQNKSIQIVHSDGRLISITMKLAIKNFDVFFYAMQGFSRAGSLKKII